MTFMAGFFAGVLFVVGAALLISYFLGERQA